MLSLKNRDAMEELPTHYAVIAQTNGIIIFEMIVFPDNGEILYSSPIHGPATFRTYQYLQIGIWLSSSLGSPG